MNHPGADPPVPVFRQHHHPADHHGPFIQGIHLRRGHRKIVVCHDDIPGVRRVVVVKLPPQRDMVLLRHGLDADIVGPGLLPGLRGPDDFKLVFRSVFHGCVLPVPSSSAIPSRPARRARSPLRPRFRSIRRAMCRWISPASAAPAPRPHRKGKPGNNCCSVNRLKC